MPLTLSPDQVSQLQQLGINVSKFTSNVSKKIKSTHNVSLKIGNIQSSPIISKPHNQLLPLLSISGFTIISFGGILLFKTKTESTPTPINPAPSNTPQNFAHPTQVPKSVQHYLLASQQFFTQALKSQSQNNQATTLQYLNQSILEASEAIKQFPSDYRGYEQRGHIYQSLIDSQPQVLSLAISDFSAAANINPNSAEITRALATLFGRQGNINNTVNYLVKTVNLEPTKAQNFYDLARIQQQIGQLSQALDTYNRLVTIITDPVQKTQIESEKTAIEHLLSQNPNPTSQFPNSNSSTTLPSISPTIPPLQTEGALLQANNGNGLIIAAPQSDHDISVSNLIDSNSLSGTATLPANQKSLVITNSHLKSTSQVYLTVTRGGKNQVLQVLSRSVNSFTVGLDTPTTSEISFKWWIIE